MSLQKLVRGGADQLVMASLGPICVVAIARYPERQTIVHYVTSLSAIHSLWTYGSPSGRLLRIGTTLFFSAVMRT